MIKNITNDRKRYRWQKNVSNDKKTLPVIKNMSNDKKNFTNDKKLWLMITKNIINYKYVRTRESILKITKQNMMVAII